METEPALQLISYYDDSIGYFPNGMVGERVGRRNAFDVVIEATISMEAECVALTLGVVAHDQVLFAHVGERGYYSSDCGMEVQIMRDGRVVSETGLLALRDSDNRNQVYFWTLRREHPVVQSLQLGDKICVYARSPSNCEITVLEGAICVIHAEDDHLTLAINSELLSRRHSEDFASKLGQLVLADDFHLSLTSLNNDGCDMDFGNVQSIFIDGASVNEHAANPDSTFGMLPQQEWFMASSNGRYEGNPCWMLLREGQGIISFEARARKSVYVAISPHYDIFSMKKDMYEIIIGDSGNTTTVIQKYREWGGTEKCGSVAGGLTHPEGLNRLWVSIDDRISAIQVGRGEPGQDVIAFYRDPFFRSTVQYVSFTSMDTPVIYSNVVITGVEHTPLLLNTYRLSEKIIQPVLNGESAMAAAYRGEYTWAQYWMLPRAGRGMLSFAVKYRCHDIHVAISSRRCTMFPMYEIEVILDRNSVETVLRKQSQGSVVCKVRSILGTSEYLFGSLGNGTIQFWVMIDDRTGTIQVGRREPCQDMFLIYKDADFLSEAQYCTFTTGSKPARFSGVSITEILD